MKGDLVLRIFVVIFAFLSVVMAESMPTVYIGTYNENNPRLIENLIKPNLPLDKKVDKGWGLSDFTEKLLKNDFKKKISSDKFNILTKDKFNRNFAKILSDKDIADKKIGFFNVDTFENSTTLSSGQKLVYITINLTFVQIGRESNRVDTSNNFEVRYTNGITVTGVLGIQPNDKNKTKTLQNGYRNFYKKALGDLIDSIIRDKRSKEVSSFTSDDIYFTIHSVILGKKAKKLALELFGNQDIAKRQISLMLQENLIDDIRADKKLDNVVLLYPDILNRVIFKNWKDYLKRINSMSLNVGSDENSAILVRKIKPCCEIRSSNGALSYVDGYYIEAVLGELYDKVAKKEDVDSARYIKASVASRIVIPIRKKFKIDGLSTPDNIIKKKKIVVAQKSYGYVIVNRLYTIERNKVGKTLRKSIEALSGKIKDMVTDIVKNREKNINFDFQKFCKE